MTPLLTKLRRDNSPLLPGVLARLQALPPGTVLVQADDGELGEFGALCDAEEWMDWKENEQRSSPGL